MTNQNKGLFTAVALAGALMLSAVPAFAQDATGSAMGGTSATSTTTHKTTKKHHKAHKPAKKHHKAAKKHHKAKSSGSSMGGSTPAATGSGM